MKILGWIIAIIGVFLLAIVHQIIAHNGLTKKEERLFLLGYGVGCFSCILLSLAWILILG